MLELSSPLRSRLSALAAIDHPGEACGVLVGRAEAGRATAVRVERLTNLARAASLASYELDPGELVAAERAARGEGLELIGFWHTHPGGAATPSERDRRGAWPGTRYLIAATGGEGLRELRAWRTEADGADWREEELG